MHGRYYGCDEISTDEQLRLLRDEPRIQDWFNKRENWQDVLGTLKAGEQYEDGNIVFFQETFNLWAGRLLWKGAE